MLCIVMRTPVMCRNKKHQSQHQQHLFFMIIALIPETIPINLLRCTLSICRLRGNPPCLISYEQVGLDCTKRPWKRDCPAYQFGMRIPLTYNNHTTSSSRSGAEMQSFVPRRNLTILPDSDKLIPLEPVYMHKVARLMHTLQCTLSSMQVAACLVLGFDLTSTIPLL